MSMVKGIMFECLCPSYSPTNVFKRVYSSLSLESLYSPASEWHYFRIGGNTAVNVPGHQAENSYRIIWTRATISYTRCTWRYVQNIKVYKKEKETVGKM